MTNEQKLNKAAEWLACMINNCAIMHAVLDGVHMMISEGEPNGPHSTTYPISGIQHEQLATLKKKLESLRDDVVALIPN